MTIGRVSRACHEHGCDNNAAEGRSRCGEHYYRYRLVSEAVRAEERLRAQRGELKVLFLDIETSPNLGYVWSLWNQNVGLPQLVNTGEVLCFAAKWAGGEMQFFSKHADGKDEMVRAAHRLLDEADVVVHYYGSVFDIKWLQTEFVLAGLTPPSPFKQLDLKNAVSKRFRFPSNKLEYVSRALGLGGKVKHQGFELWTKCMAGDDEAWAEMELYNRQDVALLEELYEILLPWLPGHPHRALYGGTGNCPLCGAVYVQAAGFYRTAQSKFRQYRCSGCGSHFRSTKREGGVKTTAVAL